MKGVFYEANQLRGSRNPHRPLGLHHSHGALRRVGDQIARMDEAFVQRHPKGNFAQSYLWSKQKPMWHWEAIAVRGEDGAIKGTLAVMIRKMPIAGRTIMYGCRGPVCDLDDRETFAQLLEGAKALARTQAARKELFRTLLAGWEQEELVQLGSLLTKLNGSYAQAR